MAFSYTGIDTNETTSGSSNTVSFTAPSSGDLLVGAVIIDKASGAFTVPTGWTEINSYDSSSVSRWFGYKISDGTETSCQFSWTDSRASKAAVAQYSATNDISLDVSAEDDSGSSTTATQSTGVTAAVAGAGELGVSVFGADSEANVFDGRGVTSGWAVRFDGITDSGIGRPGHYFVDDLSLGTGTQECEFSCTDSGDQMTGAIACFLESSGGGDDISAAGNLAFGTTADLNASGTVEASAAMSFGSGASIGATSTLEAAGSFAFGSTAELSATGALDAAGSFAFGSAAELDGVGEIDAEATLSFSTNADVTAADANDLSATANLLLGSAAALNALASIDATASFNFGSNATLAGAATLNATGTLSFATSAALTGVSNNALSATAQLQFGSIATLGPPVTSRNPDSRNIWTIQANDATAWVVQAEATNTWTIR